MIRPTTIYFVRHGVTPETGRILYGQAPGKDLSPFGKQQAKAAASRIQQLQLLPAGNHARTPRAKIAAVIASPLERAKQTAQPIARTFSLRVQTNKLLMEIDSGSHTGRTLKAVLGGKDGDHIRRNPSTYRFPRGESFPELYARLLEALSSIRSQYHGKRVVVVSHGDLIKLAIADAFGSAIEKFQHVEVAPASVSVIHYFGYDAYVHRVNDTSHLEVLSKEEA